MNSHADLIPFRAGLADLNHHDLNHLFKSHFKSTDFLIKSVI